MIPSPQESFTAVTVSLKQVSQSAAAEPGGTVPGSGGPRLLHKSSYATWQDRRSRDRFPLVQMPPAVTSLCSPWSYSLGTKSRDLGTENSRQGKNGLQGAARTRGLQFCCIAQIAEWHVHKDLCNNGRDTPSTRLRLAARAQYHGWSCLLVPRT